MSRIFLLSAVCAAGLFFLATSRGRKHLFLFFNQEAHALNLSVFRMVLFSVLFLHVWFLNPLWFNQLPRELYHPPGNLNWTSAHTPINQGWLRIACFFYFFFCVTAIFGFFSRTSAFFVTLLGILVIGLPQMYAKLNHEHHLLWFSAILACSPSADVFSLDAVAAAFRRADLGSMDPPGYSKRYGQPVAFVLLLIGVIYFFPGFWKVWTSGSEWVLGGSLKNHLYWKWSEYPDWVPFFRIDSNLLLIQALALATIIFELSFVFLLFFPRLRTWQGLSGLFFHGGTTFFMRIPFWQLQMCYIIFFNWHEIFKTLGRLFYRQTMYVLYDGNCKLCRRTIAAIRVFDIFGRIDYVNALDSASLKAHGLGEMDENALLKDMHVVLGKKVWQGYESYRALAWRVPLFWPVLPFLYLFPMAFLGNWIYRRIADFRTCSVPTPASPAPKKGSPKLGNNPVLLVVGFFLIIVNSWFGFKDLHSFPFSIYPTFENIVGDTRRSVTIEAKDVSGAPIPINTKLVQKKLTSSRWFFLLENALNIENPQKQHAYLKALWKFVAVTDPNLKRTYSVSFYKVLLTGNPDRRSQNPLTKELLFEWNEPHARIDTSGLLS